MSKSEKPVVSVTVEELQQKAFEIYVARRAHVGGSPSVTQSGAVAQQCFSDAAAFLETARQVAVGGFDPEAPKGPELDTCHAPNLSPTHPFNLVSQKYGSIKNVLEVAERFAAGEEDEVAGKYQWSNDELSRAKAIIPHWAEKISAATASQAAKALATV